MIDVYPIGPDKDQARKRSNRSKTFFVMCNWEH